MASWPGSPLFEQAVYFISTNQKDELVILSKKRRVQVDLSMRMNQFCNFFIFFWHPSEKGYLCIDKH